MNDILTYLLTFLAGKFWETTATETSVVQKMHNQLKLATSLAAKQIQNMSTIPWNWNGEGWVVPLIDSIEGSDTQTEVAHIISTAVRCPANIRSMINKRVRNSHEYAESIA